MEVKYQCLWFSNSKQQSQEAPLAPLTLLEKPNDIIVEGSVENGGGHHDHDADSRIVCSSFTMFPGFQIMPNKRALGQANRYMNVNARKRSEQDTGGTPGMNSGDSSTDGPDYDMKSLVTEAVDEDGKIAESTALTLMNISKGAVPSFACDQPTEVYLPEFEGIDIEQLDLPTIGSTGPIRKALSTDGYHCVEPLCKYYTKGFTSQARRDCHVVSHYNRTTICGFCSVNIPLGERSFPSVDAFRDHVFFWHFYEQGRAESACTTCDRNDLDPERFYYHIEDCVLQWMEKRPTEHPMKRPTDYCMEGPQVF